MREIYGNELDLNLLRVLVAVADTGAVTKAADKLYLTQPAVSAALRRLQEAVGAPLFAKQGRGIVLNARGARLVSAARQHLTALIAAASESRHGVDLHASDRTFKIGASDFLESYMVPALLKALEREAPHMRIIVQPVNFRTLNESLLSRTLDMAVTAADPTPRSIKRRKVFATDRVVLCDPRHIKLKRFSERAYFQQKHVIVSYNGDLRGYVEDYYKKTRDIRCSLHSFESVGPVIEGSNLVASIPRTTAVQIVKRHPKLAMREFDMNPGFGSISLLWLEANDDDPAAAFMREQIAKVLGKIPGGRAVSDPTSGELRD